MDRFPHKLIGGGTVLLALTAALGWGGVSMIINGQLRQSARLFNGSDTWRNFKENPNPIYRSFYLFNIENGDAMATGEKPKVKERGPYVYLERQWKEDISIDKENDTIGFRQYRSYEFQPEMSVGNTEEDMITMLNMPLLGLAKMILEVPEANRRLMASFSDKMNTAAEKLTVSHPVREFLFEGFGVRPYQEFAEGKSEILSEVGGDFIFPETFMDGRFGLFEKKNFSDDGMWEITGGRKRNSAYGAMEKINAMDTLPYWKDDTCNTLNGTVPTMFQPPLKAGRAMRPAVSRRARYNLSDFETRMFYANLELLMENTERSTWEILNDSRSRTGVRPESATFFDMSAASPPPTVNHTGFFELVRNNHLTLKNLHVRTRPDFMCFGNLSSFARDIPKIQFEDVEYSFGRTQICYEHTLLKAQTKLTKLRLHVLDDMWKHAMSAVENSHSTLTDLDAKIMNVNEDHVNISAITKCTNLKNLKLLHFCDKESACQLPSSLTKLTINGPISYKDINTWTQNLRELQELTLLLNVRGDKIDLPLYKKLLKMPRICRMSFIQCPMDLGAIRQYIDGMNFPKGGFKFWINGAREIGEVPMIQYVYTVILPEKFNREVIDIGEPFQLQQ